MHPSFITSSKTHLDETKEFIGHAMALYMNDEYMQQPAIHLVSAVQLYANSLTHYENAPSP